MEVEDPSIRFARDFQHPNGQVYRHVKDLRAGEGIKILPAVVATLFMETTAARFDPIEIRYLADGSPRILERFGELPRSMAKSRWIFVRWRRTGVAGASQSYAEQSTCGTWCIA